MRKSLCLCFSFSMLLSHYASAGPIENEVIILLDTSGSIYDSSFSTWNAMLDMAEFIVTQTESANTAHGIGIFSGNSSSHTVLSTALDGRMNMLWGLSGGALDPYTEMSINGSQNPGDVAGFVASLDESDFRSGFSWHDEALNMALSSFVGSENPSDTNKYIFMLTDGGPPTNLHESVGEGYASETMQQLRSLDVQIASVIFDTGSFFDEDYFNEFVTDPSLLISATDFGFDPASIVTSSAPSVPEPSTTVLISLGLIGLAAHNRKRHMNLKDPQSRTA